ncbi:ferredoxin reductase family protein [Microbacterium candidum]|uniref:Ferredoxin reductase family protein n=1 Tax=Microbacterium candidum TaxID=3041922 RepID=A0ABT7MZQ6_9MICO|nr:ferredoxin reductase family protein [Microbacterium sp. ASV49]MDL9979933.1 ferredoxin reductase family protein [Microbacterium sp. ASV49]
MTTLTGRPRALRTREAWHLSAVAVIWLTSLFVAALWIAGGGIRDLLAFDAESVTTLGRITGLVAANLLLYQVLLMARIPLFERGFGRDGMTRMHRLVGFWSFWLMLAHIVLIVIGYAAAAHINVIVQTWELIVDYPAMLLATAGTVLLVLVVVTSIRRARRRLRYESWHLLHLYAYVGVGLALPHELWTGADFLSSPIGTAYWWALWAAAAASVLVFRLGVPAIRSARHRLRVVSVERDGDRGVSVRVAGPNGAPRARAGQFFVWRFLDGPGWTRGHPFSLAGAPGRDLVLSARFAGDGSGRLTRLRPGTRVHIEGPYGTMTGDARVGTKLLMLGAGAGVAPLVALLEEEQYAPGDAVLITRDSGPGDALRAPQIRALVARRGLRHIALDGPRGRSWFPRTHDAWTGPQLVAYVAPDLAAYDAYVCGPPAWMDAVTADLRAAGLDRVRIHTESFEV